jgi:hypothetical protein
LAGVIEAFARGWVRARDMDAAGSAGDNADGAAADTDAMAEELEEYRRVLAELTETVDALKARVNLCFAVLRLPGVKLWLINRFHPDKHPNANETESAALNETLQTINAAYDALESAE